MVAWVHFAPPLSDSFRKTYRQLLRWNDELPFAKFAVSEDDRPVLTLELPAAELSRDAVGSLLARVWRSPISCTTRRWTDARARPRPGKAGRGFPVPDPAGAALLERYANEVAELLPVADDYLSTGPGTTG